MKTLNLLFVDEHPDQRDTYTDLLNLLLDDTNVRIRSIEPFHELHSYLQILVDEKISGLILDQKLQDGGYGYTGSELATFLRPTFPKLPIMILTNFKPEIDLSTIEEKDVEYVCSKSDIVTPTSRDAQVIKARLLRRLNVFEDVLDERQQRFHSLLLKSMNSTLTPEEQEEISILDVARTLPVHAAELAESEILEKVLEKLRRYIE